MDQCALHRGKGTASDNRQLVVLDRNLEAFLVHARHLDLEQVTIAFFEHARGPQSGRVKISKGRSLNPSDSLRFVTSNSTLLVPDHAAGPHPRDAPVQQVEVRAADRSRRDLDDGISRILHGRIGVIPDAKRTDVLEEDRAHQAGTLRRRELDVLPSWERLRWREAVEVHMAARAGE